MAGTETGIESELAAALAPLYFHRYSIETWTVENINNCNINVKQFIRAVTTFTSILNSQTRYDLLSHAVASGRLKTPEEVTIKMFYEFCIWLKTIEGNKSLLSIQEDAVTMNMAIEGMMITAFRYNIERKEIKAAYEEIIGNIRRQLVLAEKDMEEELESLADEFAPAADYEKMMADDHFTMGCIEEYKAMCNRRQANYFRYLLEATGGPLTAEQRQQCKARATQRAIDRINKRKRVDQAAANQQT